MKNFKKIFYYNCFFISLCLLNACSITMEDTSKISAPTIYYDSTAERVTLTRSNISNKVKYVLVYRQDVSEGSSEPVITIGTVYPYENNIIFQDRYYIDGKTYSYCYKFIEENNAVYTEWSTPITVESSNYTDNSDFIFDTSASNLVWNQESCTLSLADSNISSPSLYNSSDPKDSLMIILRTDSKTQAFELSDSNLAIDSIIKLENIVSEDMINTDIFIDGYFLQKIEYKDETSKEIIRRIWFEPSEISLSDDNNNSISSIKITKNIIPSGLDYSKSKSTF